MNLLPFAIALATFLGTHADAIGNSDEHHPFPIAVDTGGKLRRRLCGVPCDGTTCCVAGSCGCLRVGSDIDCGEVDAYSNPCNENSKSCCIVGDCGCVEDGDGSGTNPSSCTGACSPPVATVDKYICTKNQPLDATICADGSATGGSCTTPNNNKNCGTGGNKCWWAACPDGPTTPGPTSPPSPTPSCGHKGELCSLFEGNCCDECEGGGPPSGRVCL
mmetsp:Transcript_25115/g.42916  ORF Transcript_25115/g.42916 Transcript_25115/m.42916 type:complete len:218 (-) Transcript_25115:319-972(-)|eukprot:CAMPEP_0183724442 /NCGR_PEP_ID=MMETSP0737-20130205/17932_1 /TAXON_ID=385413 /ORGANISM="Thalassiosira miniscula, Strain CCMP1093" /LENGTH=217 /DNA_ID=CAMNT_0025955027 /DNA_START=133 /DNA_END=786 /DNA_ORIENTATION=-